MCGIVGFIGKKPAAPLLLDGLSKLEYRGYDSAGIAVLEQQKIVVHKYKGRLQILHDHIEGGVNLQSTVGIGHTRWATHGKPSDENSHPHTSNDGKFTLVHNGIIENYAVLKQELERQGVEFHSQTDTEVIVQLLARQYHGDFLQAVRDTVAQLEGSYALGILCEDYPDELVAVRHASPLIVGLADIGNFIASDIPAILSYTRRVLQLADHEMVHLTRAGVTVYDPQGVPTEKKELVVDWDVDSAEKGGYDHFMIKEIMEQPTALRNTISPRINANNEVVLDSFHMTPEQLANVTRLYVIACGSASHVGVVGKYVLEKILRVPVEVALASEFRYCDPLVDENSLVIIISQSGETADTLAGLREAKRRGARVLSIVNVVGSSIASESDDVLYTWAGPEISVATTKAYSTQLTILYLFGLWMAQKLGRIDDKTYHEVIAALKKLPDQVQEILKQAPVIKQIAKKYTFLEHAYFIGRNLDYAVALEASLKLKEISYIHSEAYAAGELKHGTISLIEEGTAVIALACCDALVEKTISNVKEVKARGANVLLLTTEAQASAHTHEVDEVLCIPETHELLLASLEVVPMQLLGYYIALARGCDIDKPRNLAKSVTVE